MKYNFDKIIDRKQYASVKWNCYNSKHNSPIPLWIADMDFEVPHEIQEEINARIKHEVFGYTQISPQYYGSLQMWMKKMHNWDIKKEWITYVPGIVTGIALTIEALTEPDDEVIIQTPVYHRFYETIKNSKCKIVENPLIDKDGYYTIDYDDLQRKISSKTKILLVCNPHNPVGRVWKKDELEKIYEIALKYNIYVISDEIHSDIVFGNNVHIPFAEVGKDAGKISIVCTSPNKTFNIAGFKLANLIVPNEEIRNKILTLSEKYHIQDPNLLGTIVQQAVYARGEEWYRQMIAYIEGNINYVVNYINTHIPRLKTVKPEGTYLLWVDFSSLNISEHRLNDILANEVGIIFNNGSAFAAKSNNYQRINIATRRALLEETMRRLNRFINKITK